MRAVSASATFAESPDPVEAAGTVDKPPPAGEAPAVADGASVAGVACAPDGLGEADGTSPGPVADDADGDGRFADDGAVAVAAALGAVVLPGAAVAVGPGRLDAVVVAPRTMTVPCISSG